ncbi:hypothetical protein [Lewinella sp. LCG006]|uniref:hypothetical protein n=1 Tax=Lewinella sp. LCG006 TaxID=3231911 RepID=UPI003460C573
MNRLQSYLLTILLLAMLFQGCHSVEDSVSRLRKVDLLSYEFTGFTGSTDTAYKDYEQLKKLTIERLLNLYEETDNTVFKGYLGWALIDKKYDRFVSFFEKTRIDTTRITVMSGCIMSDDVLSNILYNKLITERYEAIEPSYISTTVNSVDSIILSSSLRDRLFYRVMQRNAEEQKSYNLIKEIAFSNNKTAIVYLARFQKEDDLEFLHKQKELIPQVVVCFPHHSFREILNDEMNSYQCGENGYNRILAGYLMTGNPFEKIIAKLRSECTDIETRNLLISSAKYTENKPIDALIEYNWKNYREISDTGFRHLQLSRGEEIQDIILDGAINGKGEFSFICSDYEFDLKKALFQELENLPDSVKAEVIVSCVKNMNSHDLYSLQILSESIKAPSDNFLNTMIDQIGVSQYAFRMSKILDLVKPHLSFLDKDNLVKLFRENTNWDTGNWASHFRKDFKEMKIDI